MAYILLPGPAGSIRVHNEALQRHILHRILGLEEAAIERSFGHLLEALKSGCPPHGGELSSFGTMQSAAACHPLMLLSQGI